VVYLTIAFFFGLAGGVVGKLKGSSFIVWFLISAIVPFVGLLTALLYRFEREEPRRQCPNCGRICMLYDAICVRCGGRSAAVRGRRLAGTNGSLMPKSRC
jgi:hypothetical protein